MTKFHEPVLLDEAVGGLNIQVNGIYVDVTFGGGGHSREILHQLRDGQLIVFDQDQEAITNKISDDNKVIMINKNFQHLKLELDSLGISFVDGIIADLGVSGYHFTNNKRGFSLKYDSILDMRMDQNLKQNGVDVLNNYNRENLVRIFRDHADFKRPHSIVDTIMCARQKNIIQTTFELKYVLKKYVSQKTENKFFARIFQAIRIEVNDEINSLKSLLNQALKVLSPSGRLVVISYHSIEDKIVKSFMKFGNFSSSADKDFFGNSFHPFNVITKKPITPSSLEIQLNNKARSAKLRISEKI
mgnify:CR=1 FL=1